MKTVLVPALLLLASSLPALAAPTPTTCPTAIGCNRGAPGPIIGAGLPLLLVGGGIYWLVRRRKKAD